MAKTEYRRIVVECGQCSGKGIVRNPYFEDCRDDDLDRECGDCHMYDQCNKGERIPCDACDGMGKFVLYGKVVED